jgi:hypothetical protein
MNRLAKVQTITILPYLHIYSNQYAAIISFSHMRGISALTPALEPVAELRAAVPVFVRVDPVQTEETTLSRPS